MEDCICSKCSVCKQCTSGSQVHRSCLKDLPVVVDAHVSGEDVEEEGVDEVDLTAGDEEALPTLEEERESIRASTSTPLSVETVDEEDLTNPNGYKKQMLTVHVAEPSHFLKRYYPEEYANRNCEDSPGRVVGWHQNVHSWLSGEVTEKEFMVMYDVWSPLSYMFIHAASAIRMKAYVYLYGTVLICEPCYFNVLDVSERESKLITYGVLRCETENPEKLAHLLFSWPEYTFCRYCTKLLFSDVEYMEQRKWEALEGVDKKLVPHERFCCEYKSPANYVDLHVCKMIGIVNPIKRNCAFSGYPSDEDVDSD